MGAAIAFCRPVVCTGLTEEQWRKLPLANVNNHARHYHRRRRNTTASNNAPAIGSTDSIINSRSSSITDLSGSETSIGNDFDFPSGDEIGILRSTFEQLKQRRSDEIILKLIEKVAQVDGAVHVFDQAVRDHAVMSGGKQVWLPRSQGLVLLSGIERCLQLVDNPKRLRDFITGLKAIHREHYNVPGDMMAEALQVSQPVILDEVMANHRYYHQQNEKQLIDADFEQVCLVQQVWVRFITLICNVLVSSTTD